MSNYSIRLLHNRASSLSVSSATGHSWQYIFSSATKVSFTTNFVLIPTRLTKEKTFSMLQNGNITNKTFKSLHTMRGFQEIVSHRGAVFKETGETPEGPRFLWCTGTIFWRSSELANLFRPEWVFQLEKVWLMLKQKLQQKQWRDAYWLQYTVEHIKSLGTNKTTELLITGSLLLTMSYQLNRILRKQK